MNVWKAMKKWDKIIIISLIVISLAGFIPLAVSASGTSKKIAVVSVNNKVVKEIAIKGNSDKGIYPFSFGNHTGYLEVKNDSVRMLEMPKDICPEGICSSTGWIKNKYQSIVCLPNKIIVEFEHSQESDVDVVPF